MRSASARSRDASISLTAALRRLGVMHRHFTALAYDVTSPGRFLGLDSVGAAGTVRRQRSPAALRVPRYAERPSTPGDAELDAMLRAGAEARSVLDSLGLTDVASLEVSLAAGGEVWNNSPKTLRRSGLDGDPAAARRSRNARTRAPVSFNSSSGFVCDWANPPRQDERYAAAAAVNAVATAATQFVPRSHLLPPPPPPREPYFALPLTESGHATIRDEAMRLAAELDQFHFTVSGRLDQSPHLMADSDLHSAPRSSQPSPARSPARSPTRSPTRSPSRVGGNAATSPLEDTAAYLRDTFARVTSELGICAERDAAPCAADILQLSKQLSMAARIVLDAGATVQPVLISAARDTDHAVAAVAAALVEHQRIVVDALSEASSVAFEEERNAASAFYALVAPQRTQQRAGVLRACARARSAAYGACGAVAALAQEQRARDKGVHARTEAERQQQLRRSVALAAIAAAKADGKAERRREYARRRELRQREEREVRDCHGGEERRVQQRASHRAQMEVSEWRRAPSAWERPQPSPPPRQSPSRILTAWRRDPDSIATKTLERSAAIEAKRVAAAEALAERNRLNEERRLQRAARVPQRQRRVKPLLPPPPPPTPPGLAVAGLRPSPRSPVSSERDDEWNAWSRLDALRAARGKPFDGEQIKVERGLSPLKMSSLPPHRLLRGTPPNINVRL